MADAAEAQQPKLTVIILTRNEERHLERAIRSLDGIDASIMVVDSHSTDGTAEVASRLGARVFERRFINHAEQLQWAIENCAVSTPWTMKLDADEYLEDDLRQHLLTQLNAVPDDVNGIHITCKQIFFGRWIAHGGVYPLKLLRIWRTGHGRVQQQWMDEHIVVDAGGVIDWPGHFANAPLLTLREFVEKHIGYAEREARDYMRRKQAGDTAKRTWPRSQQQWKALLKSDVYERTPFLIGPFLYWIYRVVVRAGWRDGKIGMAYHFLQGFWYRTLVQVYCITDARADGGALE
jgi:glycosyltransferase involved in cell wall biosynthesis